MNDPVKFDVRPLLLANLVGSDGSGALTARRIILAVAPPVMIGLALGVWVANGLVVQNGVSVALPSASLLVGAMFGAFIFLTNLRVKLAESPTFAFRVDLLRLVGAGAASCLYLGLVAVVFAGSLALVGSVPWFRTDNIAPYTVGVLVTFATHIGLSLLGAVRRLFVIYLSLFASDFNPPIGNDASRNATAQGLNGSRDIQATRRSRKLLK
jgi:hypothetical protein